MSTYPVQKDSIAYFQVIDGITRFNSAFFQKFSSAILAIENELGIKPSGIYSDVRQRLDAVEVGINTLKIYGAAHSIVLATKFRHNWISPDIILPDTSTYTMPTVVGKAPVNLRREAGFPDGYGLLYFVNEFFVDEDVSVNFSLWDVTGIGASTQIVDQDFTYGDHTYSVVLALSLTDVDRLFEIRMKQTALLPFPTKIDSVLWNSRFLFAATGNFEGVVPVPELKYIKAFFDYSDFIDGYKLIGDINDTAMIQSVSLIIDAPFDGGAAIEVGEAALHNLLMTTADNIPSVANTYRTGCDVEITVATPINIYFPAGTPTTGAGIVIVYYH